VRRGRQPLDSRRSPTLRYARHAVNCLALVTLGCSASSTERPTIEGFELVYTQDFEGSGWASDFAVTDPAVWQGDRADDNGFLEFTGPGGYVPPRGSPADFALLGGPTVTDFILDFDVFLPGEGVRELTVFFGVQAPDRFTYASLAERTAPFEHEVLRVAGFGVKPIGTRRTFGVKLTTEVWHHVRVVRLLSHERVLVGFDDQPSPELEAREGAMEGGWIGFGATGGAARFDHLRLYAPSYQMRSLNFFGVPRER
jgi:hypothetical protein